MIKLNKLGKIGKSRIVLFELAGHTVYQSQLSEIFSIHLITLRNRLKSGWPIAPALVVPADANLDIHAINHLCSHMDYDEQMMTRLKAYFKAHPSALKG